MLAVLYIFISISLVILTNLEARNIIVDVRASWLEGITNKGMIIVFIYSFVYIITINTFT
jgi:hypothetical protein